ncbi:MAG: hypothetical protein JOZ83_14800 [Silvibacterium sp.]|nr:hypothetical protein [Silvibacterium sp.]
MNRPTGSENPTPPKALRRWKKPSRTAGCAATSGRIIVQPVKAPARASKTVSEEGNPRAGGTDPEELQLAHSNRTEEAEADDRSELQEKAGQDSGVMRLEIGHDDIGRLPRSGPVRLSRQHGHRIQARIEKHRIEDGK